MIERTNLKNIEKSQALLQQAIIEDRLPSRARHLLLAGQSLTQESLALPGKVGKFVQDLFFLVTLPVSIWFIDKKANYAAYRLTRVCLLDPLNLAVGTCSLVSKVAFSLLGVASPKLSARLWQKSLKLDLQALQLQNRCKSKIGGYWQPKSQEKVERINPHHAIQYLGKKTCLDLQLDIQPLDSLVDHQAALQELKKSFFALIKPDSHQFQTFHLWQCVANYRAPFYEKLPCLMEYGGREFFKEFSAEDKKYQAEQRKKLFQEPSPSSEEEWRKRDMEIKSAYEKKRNELVQTLLDKHWQKIEDSFPVEEKSIKMVEKLVDFYRELIAREKSKMGVRECRDNLWLQKVEKDLKQVQQDIGKLRFGSMVERPTTYLKEGFFPF